jgi:8-oxo-dGTP diphosphatase|tara:strand:- start:400 stop:867 length:468 start_codon:yes stop_codon:yes gene_type:complete
VLQFGDPDPGVDYRDRPAAFGLLVEAGQLACVRVDRGEGSYFDLPGGAVDGDETEAEALVREYIEETGLTVRPVFRLVEAAQYFRKTDGTPLNNHGGIWITERIAFDPDARVEADHELVWLDPVAALSGLRHEAHAWAVARWLRRGWALPDAIMI